jgi:hypothetical protein
MKEIEELSFHAAALQAFNEQRQDAPSSSDDADVQQLRHMVALRDQEIAAMRPKYNAAVLAQNTLSKQVQTLGKDQDDWDDMHDNLAMSRREVMEVKDKNASLEKHVESLQRMIQSAQVPLTAAGKFGDAPVKRNPNPAMPFYQQTIAKPVNANPNGIRLPPPPPLKRNGPIAFVQEQPPQPSLKRNRPIPSVQEQPPPPPLKRNGPIAFVHEQPPPPPLKRNGPIGFVHEQPPPPALKRNGPIAFLHHEPFVPLPSSFVPLEDFYNSVQDEAPPPPVSTKRRKAGR